MSGCCGLFSLCVCFPMCIVCYECVLELFYLYVSPSSDYSPNNSVFIISYCLKLSFRLNLNILLDLFSMKSQCMSIM